MSATKITRRILLLGFVLMILMISIMLPSATLTTSRAKTIAQSDARHSTSNTAGDKSVVIYVSATDGNDQWSGRLPFPNFERTDGPLASFDQARQVVQAIDKTGVAQVTVLFRGGTYYLPATVTFTEADSGTASTEIIYQNFFGESPVFGEQCCRGLWADHPGSVRHRSGLRTRQSLHTQRRLRWLPLRHLDLTAIRECPAAWH